MIRSIKKLTLILMCLFLLLVVFDAKNAMVSAKNALELCLVTVVPSIFPLLFISTAIANEINDIEVPVLENVLHIPKGTSWLFLISLLCGYPAGGKLLQNQIKQKRISTESACRMMLFCNNAGPAFIIGMLTSIFSAEAAITMWIIQIVSSFSVGMIVPVSSLENSEMKIQNTSNPSPIMSDSLKAVASICGWIIIFSVLIDYADRYLLNNLNSVSNILIKGMIELTNGLSLSSQIESRPVAFTINAVLLSTGGLCVVLQSKSVAPDMKVVSYIIGKLLHAGISGTLAAVASFFLFPTYDTPLKIIPLFLCISILSYIVLVFNKKTIAFHRKV